MTKHILSVSFLALFAGTAFAASKPLLVPDYNRDGKIDEADSIRLAKGEAFAVWLNDDDDADGAESDEGRGDTNTDLHDVPGGDDNDKDYEDDKVNGRCDLLDFFPMLVDVTGVPDWSDYTWKLSSHSVNVVFTGLRADTAGSFHTTDVKGLDGDTPLYKESVSKLAGDDGEDAGLPDEFFNEGRGVILIEGAALAEDGGLTLCGTKDDSDPVEVTLKLRVTNVEDMYGWMNLRDKVKDEGEGEQWKVENSTVQPSTSNLQPDYRHFILVHGYNTNHEEARGNAAEFYKKLYQSGADARFTAVEWRGDQSKMDIFGISFSPNYHVNVENAFAAARPFAEACKRMPGEKILVGHSLGNMLISSAIKDYGLDYTKFVMLNAAVAREAYDAGAYDEAMVSAGWKGEGEGVGGGVGGDGLTNHLDRASRWYRNFADHKYDPYEYRRKLAWRGRFANLPRTVNYYSPTDNILKNPASDDPDDFDETDAKDVGKVRDLLGKAFSLGGFWSLSEKLKGRPTLIDTINHVLTNVFEMAASDAYKCEGGWGENPNYVEGLPFSPTNTHFTPFLDERMKTIGMLDILPAETERLRAQHLADAIPAESFAAGANPVATLENVNMEGFIGANPDWPVKEEARGEGEGVGEEGKNEWKHSTFREVAFYHTSKFYASLAAVGKPRVIIDTDLGSSMDDLFTIDLAARMHKQDKLDLMAVMINRPDYSDPEGKGEFLKFADRYLASLGLGDLPLGTSTPLAQKRLPQTVFNPYWTLIYSNNVTGVGQLLPTNRTDAQIGALTNAVTLYRRLLNAAPSNSVVICSLGFLNNLKELMDSGSNYKGDEIGFTGLELIAAKVKELRIMGGCFDPSTLPDGKDGAEYNFAGDPAAAKKVVEEWPTPVVLSTWEVGLKLNYKTPNVLADFPPGTFDPVVRAAYTYWPDPIDDSIVKNRLWDPMTVLPLAEGETLAPLSEMGGVSVDEKGRTTFTPNASSNRCYQVASNMNANAVMNRFRAICRTGNPSVSVVPISPAEPGVDYNGSVMSIEFYDVELGQYEIKDLCASLTVAGEVYEPDPDSIRYDELGGVLSFTITVPPDKVTAGNEYDGEVKVGFASDTLGTNIVYTRTRKLVQGRQEQDEPTDWFYEMAFATPTNYVPETEMPAKVSAKVNTTVSFTGQPFEERFLSAAKAVQSAVRIVKDGADGYKFQFYAFTADENEHLHEGWWDCNVSNVVPVAGKDYEITAELMYPVDAQRQLHTVAFFVKDAGDNRPAVRVFLGNMIDDDGGIGNAGRLGSVAFTERGEVYSLDGYTLVNKVNANLARIDGYDDEYAKVAEAVAAADGEPIRLLWKASWKPTAADIGKSVKFLNKGRLVLDLSGLPPEMCPVWTDVEGNNGTLTLKPMYSGLRKIVPYLHEIWYEDYKDSTLTGEDAPFGDLPVQGMGGCSSVRVGNFHGRNLDIAVSDLASIVIHMSASSNRFASVGTTQWGDVSETALTNGAVSVHRFCVLPNWMLDGINEKGVAINVNIIPMDVPQDGENPDSDERPALHARKVARYVLDHAESAAGVIEQLKGFRVFGNIGAVANNIHWMISDAEKTFVVEVIQGEVVAREHPIMTNFNINWDNKKKSKITDPENWGPEKYFWAAAHSNDTDTIFETYSLHAEGIERYIRLRDNKGGYLMRGATFEGMFDLMRETQYSKIAYLPLAETYLSDLLDMQEVKVAGFESLADIYAASNATKLAEMWKELRPKMTNVYENLAQHRKPDTMVPYSITTHNVTFDLEKKMFRIAVQEDYAHTFDFYLRDKPVEPVTPGEPLGPYKTAEKATNVAHKAVLTLRQDVATVLESDEARETYRKMFGFDVTGGGEAWFVEAVLLPPDWTNVVESASQATLQLPIADIAALGQDENPIPVSLTNCVPGFFYSLYDGASVTNIRAVQIEEDLNVLCGANKEVALPKVAKPIGGQDSGFFSIGVLETPTVSRGEEYHSPTKLTRDKE